MIRRFRHKGLERFFLSGDQSGVAGQHVRKLSQILAMLHASASPEGMNLPGFRLHQLKGDRKGSWAVSVSGNWRIVFTFHGGDATDVDLVDYH